MAAKIDNTPTPKQKGAPSLPPHQSSHVLRNNLSKPPRISHFPKINRHKIALSRHSPLVTRHCSSTTLADGHAGPSIFAVTRIASIKVQKLMGTQFGLFLLCNIVTSHRIDRYTCRTKNRVKAPGISHMTENYSIHFRGLWQAGEESPPALNALLWREERLVPAGIRIRPFSAILATYWAGRCLMQVEGHSLEARARHVRISTNPLLGTRRG